MKLKTGLSLMVLIITIIVMTILAGSTVIILNGTNVLDNAKDATDKTNLKQVEEWAAFAWAKAYTKGIRDIDELMDAVNLELQKNDVDIDKYLIQVSENGVKVTLKSDIEDEIEK